MFNKVIFDFEEVKIFLNELEKKSVTNKYILKKQKNNWKTTCEIPISHYTIGKGKKHIVFFGAFHGSEIISTEFLLNFLNDIIENENKYKEILEEYVLNFIPIVNPEGYIITTSIIRKYIKRNENIKELEKKCKKYIDACKQDDIEVKTLIKQGIEHKKIKHHQKMFENFTYNDIPEKYSKIKEKLKKIYENSKIPDGAIILWSANANGIDLNANTKYNKNISKIKSGQTLYMPNRYSNIVTSNPGPINCPFDKTNGFLDEIENIYISNFLEDLNTKNKLSAIFNYHSAGALIDHRPSNIPEDLKYKNINLKLKSLNNYLFAKIYQSETYKDFNKKQDTNYKLLKEPSEIRTRNGYYRVVYPLDLLIELSELIGNPLGPYSNLEVNYKSIMESNTNAILKSIKNLEISNKISTEVYEWMKVNFKNLDDEDFIQKGYNIIDEIFAKIASSLL